MSDAKHRIIAAIVGLPLLALGTFVGGGLGMWADYLFHAGMVAPDKFRWSDMFYIGGLGTLIPATPSLLIFLTLSIIWCMPLARQILLSLILSLILGITGIVVFNLMADSRGNLLPYYVKAGETCLVIVSLIGMAMKWKPSLCRSSRD